MKRMIRMAFALISIFLLTGFARPTSLPEASSAPNVAPEINAVAAPAVDLVSQAQAPGPGPTDPAEVKAFLDDLFTSQMEDYHIAGLTVSLVKDGQVFYQKGYGYADLEKQTPVDPAATIFRTGSVTKLFTWTAVMQLVEQGKLDLDADVNTYLDFSIPETYPEPITLRHLLSHTAGFEDLAFDTKVAGYDQIPPLGQYLARHIPARVRPAGQMAVYSNYGADLAGYIVERASGLPYADYLEENIFKPLGMRNTTARLSLPSEMGSQLSTGYQSLQGVLTPAPFRIPGTQPDCCISSTAADMARFMIAHLNGGQIPGENGKILEASTVSQMQASLWTPDERLTGFAYGFMEVVRGGQRILYHGGDISPFHSLLVLIPDQNLGFFVSYNTDTAAGLWMLDLLSFVDHYYPQDQAALQQPADSNAQVSSLAGYYRPVRSSYTTMEKVYVLKNWAVLKPSTDGSFVWQSAFAPVGIRIVEIAPLLFAEPESGLTSVFVKDDQRHTTVVYDALPAALPYEKLPWHANPYLHYGLLGVCSLLLLSAVLVAPAGFLIRLFKKEKPASQPLSRTARWLAFLAAGLDLLALGIFLALFLGSGDAIFYGQASTLNVMLGAWLIAAVLTLALLGFAFIAWKRRFWGIAARIHYTLVAAAALGFVWFLNYWNLLGFRY